MAQLRRAIPPFVLILLMLNSCSQIHGWPDFVFPTGLGITQQEKDALPQAFEDAIEIARLVAATFDSCADGQSPAFDRYFRPTDSLMVQSVFRSIANIDLNLELNQGNMLHFMFADLNPKFGQRLSISLGDHPFVLSIIAGDKSCDSNRAPDAYLNMSPDGDAVISFCLRSIYYPKLKDIYEKPDWAANMEGYGCDGLGDRDTDFMRPAGGIMLHELIHWSYLYLDIPGWNNVQLPNDIGVPTIPDYGGPNPPNGYGCYHAKMIRDTPGGGYNTLRNVENYVCYALSKYWSWKCQKAFGPSLSQADSHRRQDQVYEQNFPDTPEEDRYPSPDWPLPSPPTNS